MEKIILHNTLPRVFAGHNGIHSDVWLQNITLERGKRYLISAESGTGKSSMCSYIYGYRQDYSGDIAFDGQDIGSLTVAQWCDIRQQHIAYLPQEMRLFGELTAMENVEIKNSLTGFKTRKEIEGWFEALGIADKMQSPVQLLSFGQQQRVAMIRALVQPFDFLLADEPISHLDETNSRMMADIMTEEARRQGAGIVVTSIGKHMDLPYDKILKL